MNIKWLSNQANTESLTSARLAQNAKKNREGKEKQKRKRSLSVRRREGQLEREKERQSEKMR